MTTPSTSIAFLETLYRIMLAAVDPMQGIRLATLELPLLIEQHNRLAGELVNAR